METNMDAVILLQDLYEFLAKLELNLISENEKQAMFDRFSVALENTILENGGSLPPQE